MYVIRCWRTNLADDDWLTFGMIGESGIDGIPGSSGSSTTTKTDRTPCSSASLTKTVPATSYFLIGSRPSRLFIFEIKVAPVGSSLFLSVRSVRDRVIVSHREHRWASLREDREDRGIVRIVSRSGRSSGRAGRTERSAEAAKRALIQICAMDFRDFACESDWSDRRSDWRCLEV